MTTKAKPIPTMQYKTFKWPFNPENCNIAYAKRTISHMYPEINGGEYEELGAEPRIISGSGEFFGKYAYSNFKKLLALFYEKTTGKLIHPTWGAINVKFTKFNSEEKPLKNYVAYTFEFIETMNINVIEDPNKKTSSSKSSSSSSSGTVGNKAYIIKSGDTLWDISKKYYGTGAKWKTIADANKKVIANPNKLTIGKKIIIP